MVQASKRPSVLHQFSWWDIWSFFRFSHTFTTGWASWSDLESFRIQTWNTASWSVSFLLLQFYGSIFSVICNESNTVQKNWGAIRSFECGGGYYSLIVSSSLHFFQIWIEDRLVLIISNLSFSSWDDQRRHNEWIFLIFCAKETLSRLPKAEW
jgi:hypothetical protein